MKNIFFGFICFIAFNLNVNCQNESDISLIQKRASIHLEECISFNEMAGVTAAIWKDGKTIWKDGKGHSDIENNILAEANMLHRIASISKPMTAIAILQLMEKGLVKLDDPVVKHLHFFPKKYSNITINHLLNHTSGIKAYKSRAESFPTKQYDGLQEAVELFQNRSLANNPGEAYQYTTYGYVVLGAIIEKVSGQDYRIYMKENIWKVAGMENTDVEIYGQKYPNKSKLYVKNGNEFLPDIQTNLSVKVPGGGIQSTAEDLLKFGQAIINHKLITSNTFDLMIMDSGKKKTGNPYGLGWFLYGKKDGPNGRIIGHSGSQSGTSTQFMIYLDYNLVVATLSNTNGAWNQVYNLNGKLAELVIKPESLKMSMKKAIPISTPILDRYVGDYDSDDGKNIEIYRKGKSLYAKKEGIDEIELFASAEDKFFARTYNMEVEFTMNQNKIASSMAIIEGSHISQHQRIDYKKSIGRELYNIMADEDSKAGIKWFKKVKDNSDYKIDGDVMNQVGYGLINIGEIKEALDVFKLNKSSFPNDPKLINEDVMINVGDQLLAAGYEDLAFDYYKFNLEVYPESWKAHESLGKAYLEIDKKKKALKMYKKAAELNPDNEEVKSKIQHLSYSK